MGYEELPGIKNYMFSDFSAGWFPGKEHNEIPGELSNPALPIGAREADSMIWYDGALRKFPGYTQTNTLALNGGFGFTSLFYSPVLEEFVGTVGDRIFSGCNNAVPTDITGAVVLTANLNVKWEEWDFDTTQLVIGVNGTDSPFRWNSVGNCTVLGGTPPAGKWVKSFQDALWIANTTARPSTVFFSNIGDPEVWSAGDDYKFDAPITGMDVLGDKLVVFTEKSVGFLSGTNNRILTKIEKFIDGIGCSSGYTVKRAKLAGRDVLVFHSYDGFYAFDGSQELIRLSSPITNKYRGSSSTTRWNENRFSSAWATYFPKFGWYMCVLSDGGDSTNNFLLVLDMNRPYQDSQGIYVPHWPIDSIQGNCIEFFRSSSFVENVFFGNNSGNVLKFDQATFNRNGSAYTGYFTSKNYDPIESTILQEANVIGTIDNATVDVCINYDLQAGDGECDELSLTADEDQLDIDFYMDISTLVDDDFIFQSADIYNFGRFIQFKLSNDQANQDPRIQKFNLVLQSFGVETNVGR